MMRSRIFAGGFAALLAAAPAGAVVINFSNQTDGSKPPVLVYPGATFTSDTGQFFIESVFGPQQLCPYTTSFNCAGGVGVAFTAPVNDLTFVSAVDDSVVSSVFVTVTTLSGVFSFTGATDGNGLTLDLQDLSAYADVTGIFITNDDDAGLLYDDFTFNVAADPAIPEPATWAMMVLGFGLTGAAVRRRAGRTAAV